MKLVLQDTKKVEYALRIWRSRTPFDQSTRCDSIDTRIHTDLAQTEWRLAPFAPLLDFDRPYDYCNVGMKLQRLSKHPNRRERLAGHDPEINHPKEIPRHSKGKYFYLYEIETCSLREGCNTLYVLCRRRQRCLEA